MDWVAGLDHPGPPPPPDPPRHFQSRRHIALALACCVIGTAGGVLGLTDLAAPELSSLLYAWFLMLTCVATAIAAFAVLRRWSWGPPLLVIAATAIAINAGSLVAATFTTGDPSGITALLSTLLLISLATIAVFWGALPTLLDGLQPLLTAAASLGVTVSLLTTIGFNLYDTQSHSGNIGAAITASATVTLASKAGTLQFLSVQVTMENSGTAKVQTVGSFYTITATNVSAANRPDSDFFGTAVRPEQNDGKYYFDFPDSRSFREHNATVVQLGRLLPDATYFEPGQKFSQRFDVAVPKDKYDLVHFAGWIAVANGARLNLSSALPAPAPTVVTDEAPGWTFSRREWGLVESSHVHRIERQSRSVYEILLTQAPASDFPERPKTGQPNNGGAPTVPAWDVCIARSHKKAQCDFNSAQQSRRLAKFYGLAFIPVTDDLALPAAAKKS